MADLKFTVFKTPGESNTDEALAIAKANAEALGIKSIVVASTRGKTALKAAEIFPPDKYNLVAVTHNYWFRDGIEQEFDKETRNKLEEKGVKVFSGTLAFSGVDSALQKTYGHWSFGALYGRVVRTVFCDGIKVCQEIVLMATDAGLIGNEEDVIAVAGTGLGADTVCLIKSSTTRKFTEMRVKAIFAKPL